MKKNKNKAFTLIEILVWITIVSILIIWISNINFNTISEKKRLDRSIIKIVSQIETVRNNSLLGKWIWENLEIPKNYELHIWNTWSWKIVIYYNTWSTDSEKQIYNLEKDIKFWDNFENISKMTCLDIKWNIVTDEDNDNNIKNWTGIIKFEWKNLTILWACDKPKSKIFEFEITRKTHKQNIQINTLNWLIEVKK